MARASGVLVIGVMLFAAACSGTSAPASTSLPTTANAAVRIPNSGGTLEGHTPTAFAGMGTGLFVGDNLNTSFPEGVGVQLYLTFALPPSLTVSTAVIASDALHIAGAPFEDLGPLLIEPVEYSAFGPELFDLEATGNPVVCSVTGEATIECPVTDALDTAASRGDSNVQFRIRFDIEADNDGQQDLAMFFRENSNTNESGLFELVITPGS
jgi:hypothetical protein